MFGKDMYGTEILRVDNKNRISLASFSNVEKGEELLLVMDDDYYNIYSKLYCEELLDKFEETGDIKSIIEFCKKIKRKLIVDSYKRVNLGNEFNDEEYIRVIGCRRFISLEQVKKR